jgi:uncharacterized protein
MGRNQGASRRENSLVAPAFAVLAARCQQFHAHGTLLLVGTFAAVQAEGAMGIFSSRESAEEFVRGDPFVLNQVVRDWKIREWNEALGG